MTHRWPSTSVTSKKSPNVCKSCPKRISLVKWKILTPLQKLPKMCWWLGQPNYCPGLWKVAQIIKNRPIWSHCLVRSRVSIFTSKSFSLFPVAILLIVLKMSLKVERVKWLSRAIGIKIFVKSKLKRLPQTKLAKDQWLEKTFLCQNWHHSA